MAKQIRRKAPAKQKNAVWPWAILALLVIGAVAVWLGAQQ